MTLSMADSPRIRLNCWKMKPNVRRRIPVRKRSGRPEMSRPFEPHAAGGGPRQAADHGQQRGLAGTAGAEERRHLLRRDGQVDAVERPELVVASLVEGFANAGEFDHSQPRITVSGSVMAARQIGTMVATA